MSLTATMHSWCDDFKIKRNDRAETIAKIKKNSSYVIQRHIEKRVKMGAKTRETLHSVNTSIKKKAMIILTSYIKDRSEAIEILAAMRGKNIRQ